jgi:ABC-type polysaccharide/polyol phosphate transport system ATPase subunit
VSGSTPVIEMRGLGKRYTKYDDRPLLVNHLRFWHRTTRSDLWALRGIELEIGAGESVGILGRNGAGKSTLLQLLAGVTAPTEGLVRVRGRVAPLLSVGVGFHPELTGRENVYVNGTVLGLSKATLDRKFDDIVQFAELEAFIDTPVKFYSSGMFVRLGFSVAVEAEPDILLVDEVLSVGDFSFSMRSFERMQQIRAQGATLVVVSHNLNAIRGYSDRTLLINQGELIFDGPTPEGIGRYYQLLEPKREVAGDSDATGINTVEDGPSLELIDFDLVDDAGSATSYVHAGDLGVVRIETRARGDIDRPFANVTIATERGVVVYSVSNADTPFRPLRDGERAVMTFRLPLHLVSGGYVVAASLHSGTFADSVVLAQAEKVSFFVAGRQLVGGVADLGGEFDLQSAD